MFTLAHELATEALADLDNFATLRAVRRGKAMKRRYWAAAGLAALVVGCDGAPSDAPATDAEVAAGGSGGAPIGGQGGAEPVGGQGGAEPVGGEGGAPVGGEGGSGGGAGGAGGEGGTVTPDPDPLVPEACAEPGRPTMRRLNRFEYANAMRDLLGGEVDWSAALPEDDLGYGFDTIGDVLTLSGLHVEGYLGAAGEAVDLALDGPQQSVRLTFEAEDVGSDVGAAHRGEAWNLWSRGEMTTEIVLPADGRYAVRAGAWGQQAGPDPVRMSILVDRQSVQQFDVRAEGGNTETYEATVELRQGPHSLSVTFDNDYYMPDHPDPAQRDRNLLLDWFEIEGPLDAAPADPAVRARVMVCEPADGDDEACARQIIETFARRAWRRPVEAGELDRLMGFIGLAREQGDDLDQGIRLALQAVLLSPHFLFRVEGGDTARRLTDHELASRLSFFLWGSVPDAALLDAADAGTLSAPETLAAQVDRMLDDPRARRSIDHFGDQWLHTSSMGDVAPDWHFFPDFDDALRASMTTEAQTFFAHKLLANEGLGDLLVSDYTFLDARLAEHYDLPLEGPAVEGLEGWHQVPLAGTQRGGLLTLGAVLTVTSFPTRTSPVKRGKWVLDQLMCIPPAPPPPGVEGDLEGVDPDASLRERLEQHREDPACAACHDMMDPIGLGLDTYDGIGAWRTHEGPHEIDPAGELPGGRAFAGALELGGIVADDAMLGRCFSHKLATYAVGRGVPNWDACLRETVVDRTAPEGHRMRDLVHALVQSPLFTHVGAAEDE